jgi:hypothetical protein
MSYEYILDCFLYLIIIDFFMTVFCGAMSIRSCGYGRSLKAAWRKRQASHWEQG